MLLYSSINKNQPRSLENTMRIFGHGRVFSGSEYLEKSKHSEA